MKEVNEREEVYQPDEREEVYQPEIYRLTFEHYVDCGEKRIKLDEPLVVQMAISRYEPSPVCINRMLDMMRNEVINRMGLEWRK